jgi:hypothetical protein
MNLPRISIQLDRRDGRYPPGDTVHAQIALGDPEETSAAVEALECSVLWYTVGKGEEDLAVHHFERLESDRLNSQACEPPMTIQCALPASPLSYDGVIVKVCWCVRARAFLQGGQEVVEDAPFRLGDVPAAKIVPE